MKCSVTSSPGVTGEVVVSQPVEPPGMLASGGGAGSNGSGIGGSSKPVPPISETGRAQCCVCGLVLSLVQTVKNPLLTVIGCFCISNAMFDGDENSACDSCRTKNSSLNSVQTQTGYSADKNWKSNENELALV